MSLVTRCPACATTFKVVRDQLRISDGWVRCGRCSEVFDATVDLRETSDAVPPAASPAVAVAASPPPMPEPPAPSAADEVDALDGAEPALGETGAEEDATAFSEADFLDDEHDESAPPPETAATDSPPPPPAPMPAPAASRAAAMRPVDFTPTDRLPLAGVVADEPWPGVGLEDDMLSVEEGRMVVRPPPPPPLAFPDIDLNLTPGPPSRPDMLSSTGDETGNAQLQKALRRARVKSAKIAKSKARSEKAAATEPAPLVLAASESERTDDAREGPDGSGAADASAFLQRRAVRLSLRGLAVLAVLLLIAQVLRQERDLIAARQPALRPALEALCSFTGCQVSALRQIGDITIDGASFARERNGDAYRLSFTLRSAANVPLAMPAVELTLLDTQERAVVRRVLMPAEFGAPPVLSPRGERSASLPLGLTGPEVALVPPIAGYRVIAFYP